MCDIPPLPTIGLAMPWQAPTEWAIFLVLILVMAGVAVSVRFLPRRWRRWERHWSLPARAVQVASLLCGVSAVALLLLLVQPANDALYAWDVQASATYAALQSATCEHVIDTVYQARSDQIDSFFIAAMVLVAIELLLLGILQWRFPPQRIEAAGPPPIAPVPQQ